MSLTPRDDLLSRLSAGRGLDAVKLAAILRHERAHLDGADEREARRVEAQTVRRILQDVPADYLVSGMLYAAEVEEYAAAPGRR